jgi:hypothetical protein
MDINTPNLEELKQPHDVFFHAQLGFVKPGSETIKIFPASEYKIPAENGIYDVNEMSSIAINFCQQFLLDNALMHETEALVVINKEDIEPVIAYLKARDVVKKNQADYLAGNYDLGN